LIYLFIYLFVHSFVYIRLRLVNRPQLDIGNIKYKNSSANETANLNLYDDIAHLLQNTKKNLLHLAN